MYYRDTYGLEEDVYWNVVNSGIMKLAYVGVAEDKAFGAMTMEDYQKKVTKFIKAGVPQSRIVTIQMHYEFVGRYI